MRGKAVTIMEGSLLVQKFEVRTPYCMYFTIEISDYYGVEESPGARVGISNSIAVR